jgi:hypothetical protein
MTTFVGQEVKTLRGEVLLCLLQWHMGWAEERCPRNNGAWCNLLGYLGVVDVYKVRL